MMPNKLIKRGKLHEHFKIGGRGLPSLYAELQEPLAAIVIGDLITSTRVYFADFADA